MAWVKLPIQDQWQNALDVNAAGFVFKTYLANTTTPTPMSIDQNGSTTVSTVTLNADGIPEVSGNEVTLYIDQDFRFAIYENATDASNDINAFYGPVDVYNILEGILSTVSNYAALRALDSSSLTDGEIITVTDDGIAGDFVIKTGTVTDNGGTLIVFTDDSNRYAERMRGQKDSEPSWFGCIPTLGSSPVDVTAEMQAYADFCADEQVEFILDGSDVAGGEYRISSPITFTKNVRVFGRGGIMAPILCNNCSLFIWPTGAVNVMVRGIRAAQAVRHTTTPNSFRALTFPGNTSQRPYWSDIKENFFDGFAVNVDIEFGWEFRIKDNHFLNCRQMVLSVGVTINNWLVDNEGTGNGVAVQIGDGTGSVEGWQIQRNLIFGFSQAVLLTGAAFNYVIDNIIDSITGGTAVLCISTATYPTFGNKIKGNYIAFSDAANEGIRLANSTASSGNVGSTVEDNEIFTYSGSGGTLGKGILIDGSSETKNRVIGNSIDANIADCDMSGSTQSIVRDNKFNGAGFRTNVIVEYEGNAGTQITSEALLKRTFGSRTEYWGTAQPTSGTYVAGDKVWKITPAALDGNSMVNMGWYRLTTGSNHVSGTDWANMYVSHTSPAV